MSRSNAIARPIGRIVHRVPGRARVKLDRRDDSLEVLLRIEQSLAAVSGVSRCTANPATRSLLVRYDDGVELADAASAAGLTLVDPPPDPDGRDERAPLDDQQHPHSRLARGINARLEALDRRVRRMTGHHVDLKLLLPIGFGALAVRQIVASSGNLVPIPWYVLLWYAFDSYARAHRTPQGKAVQSLMEEATQVADAGE